MPKSISSNTDNSDTPVRRSSRARKEPLHSYKDDLPDNVLHKVMDGVEPEVKMPEGWGASDDSEDDYKPDKEKNKKLKQKKHSESSDDDDVGQSQSRKRKSAVFKSKPEHKRSKKINSGQILKVTSKSENRHTCLVCRGHQEGGDKLLLLSDKAEARYHYAECYYRNGAFWEDCPAGEDNKVEEKKRVKDEFGRLVKYTCKQCSWGNMGYKEYCIHMALAHGLLEKCLEEDSSYDGMPYVLEKLDMRK